MVDLDSLTAVYRISSGFANFLMRYIGYIEHRDQKNYFKIYVKLISFQIFRFLLKLSTFLHVQDFSIEKFVNFNETCNKFKSIFKN